MALRSNEKPVFADRDPLVGLIQAAIQSLEELGKIEKPADPGVLAYDGYCARSSAAYLYLVEHDARAKALAGDPSVKLRRAKPQGHDEAHFWLENSLGQILELNAGPEDKRSRLKYPYKEGKGASLLRDAEDPTLPKRHDSQRLIAVVRATLDAVDAPS